MPNLRSSFKRVNVAAKKAAQNRPVRTGARNAVTKARNSIASGDADEARQGVVDAIRALDKAASKGVIHKNNAARRKSRLVKRLNASTVQE